MWIRDFFVLTGKSRGPIITFQNKTQRFFLFCGAWNGLPVTFMIQEEPVSAVQEPSPNTVKFPKDISSIGFRLQFILNSWTLYYISISYHILKNIFHIHALLYWAQSLLVTLDITLYLLCSGFSCLFTSSGYGQVYKLLHIHLVQPKAQWSCGGLCVYYKVGSLSLGTQSAVRRCRPLCIQSDALSRKW